jgi:hypothetical protein
MRSYVRVEKKSTFRFNLIVLAERHTQKDLTLIADIGAWLSHQTKAHGGKMKAAVWVTSWRNLAELIGVKYLNWGPLMQYQYDRECTATIRAGCVKRLRCVLTKVEWGVDVRLSCL